ncbi:MAG: outer membrane protein assembly factor BamE domain-containing protein [Microcoleaceae cyanobacterium]
MNRFTKFQYDQVRVGMTYEDVRKILGSEGERDEGFTTNPESKQVSYHWVNPDGSSISMVFDAEQKVVKLASYNLPTESNLQFARQPSSQTPSSDNREPKTTLENRSIRQFGIDQYNKIKLGMAAAEVESILGSQGRAEGLSNPPSGYVQGIRYFWSNPDRSSIVVMFNADQQVTSVSSLNLDRYVFGEPAPSNQPEGPMIATRTQYYQLRLGMTYEQVQRVMGTPGTATNFNPEGGETFKITYEWMNPDGSGIKVLFNAENQTMKVYSYGLGVGLRP